MSTIFDKNSELIVLLGGFDQPNFGGKGSRSGYFEETVATRQRKGVTHV